jgi:hypothetical protein
MLESNPMKIASFFVILPTALPRGRKDVQNAESINNQ